MAVAPQLRVGVIETAVAAFAGTGVEGIPGVEQMDTDLGLDQEETIEVWTEHFACVFTE